MSESIHNCRLTATEMQLVALFRQELADEATPPSQWRLIINAGNGAMSSQFERIDRIDFRGQNKPTPEYVQEAAAVLMRRVMPTDGALTDYTVTVEVNGDRARAFRSRKGAKTLPKVGG